ncbi:hypothetical protein VTN00DRAFT_9499 [Thermoascus crustaceus]|uniref:uncharacterized protein n=1 Tax=Thermoascus crustaceus TaxID=5088 RepID=UPI00374333CA
MSSDISTDVLEHASHGTGHDGDPDLIGPARQFLLVHKSLTSPENVATRAAIFTEFSKILLGDLLQKVKIGQGGMPDGYQSVSEGGHLLVVQAGSHALGIWNPSDPMSCLCLGSVSQSTFYSIAEKKLRSAEDKMHLRILRKLWDPETESGAAFHIVMRGVLIKLQYCCIGAYEMARWESLLVQPSQKVALPSEVLVSLNTCRDIRYICDTIPNLEKFQTVYRILELWSRCRGIYSGPLGYLDRDRLVLLLNHLWKVRPVNDTPVSSIVSEFFASYSVFNWGRETIVDPTQDDAKSEIPYIRRDNAAAIMTIFAPVKNVASSVTKNTLKTLQREFNRAKDLANPANLSWDDLMGVRGTDISNPFSTATAEFVQKFNIFVRFDIRYWGSNTASRTRFFDDMGMQYASLFARLSNLDLRVYLRSYDSLAFAWPYRLTETATNVQDENSFYLIGLDYDVAGKCRQQFSDRLRLECEEFARKLYEDGIFDPTTAWISFSIVEKQELGEIGLHREVGIREVPAIMSQSRYDENTSLRGVLPSDQQPSQRESKKADTQRKAQKLAQSKLRPAVDILNRLTWDSNFDRKDYIIGYEDRFAGSLEMPLDSWKGDSTDEEFIPRHRILYFKRRSDNEIVWDRNKKIDKIFGSGNAVHM